MLEHGAEILMQFKHYWELYKKQQIETQFIAT